MNFALYKVGLEVLSNTGRSFPDLDSFSYNRQNQISATLANSRCIEGEVRGYCPPNCAILVGQIRVLYDILPTMQHKSAKMENN